MLLTSGFESFEASEAFERFNSFFGCGLQKISYHYVTAAGVLNAVMLSLTLYIEVDEKVLEQEKSSYHRLSSSYCSPSVPLISDPPQTRKDIFVGLFM